MLNAGNLVKRWPTGYRGAVNYITLITLLITLYGVNPKNFKVLKTSQTGDVVSSKAHEQLHEKLLFFLQLQTDFNKSELVVSFYG